MNCPICLSLCVFPIQLKCEHIFCYLCLKGVTNHNNKCPLCRHRINKNTLNRPKFVKKSLNSDRPSAAFQTNQWYYSGNKGQGWWAYDYKSCQQLEQAFNSGLKKCEITIAGVDYWIDFENKVQYRNDMPERKRKITRDLLSNLDIAKGVAGVSKKLVKDVFGQLSTHETNDGICDQQNVLNCSSNSIVTHSVDNETQNEVKIKIEIKLEDNNQT